MKITMKVVGIAIGAMAMVLLYNTGDAVKSHQYDKATFELILAIINIYLSDRLLSYAEQSK